MANRFLQPTLIAPTKNQEPVLEDAEKKVKVAMEKINIFFISDWKSYQEEASELSLELIKSYDTIKKVEEEKKSNCMNYKGL